ncbi:SA1002 family membrane protein, partial [Microbacterium sp.]|uniref:SA1002 family membrane protein n=1 Tax=Microbacterium sp. TaxID=51671 RepID=UPI003A8C54BD
NALGVQVGVLLGTLVVVVAGGVALFLIARPVMHQLRVTHERLAIIEYYIQWSLIYLTVYQVVVGQIDSKTGFLGDATLTHELRKLVGSVLDPAAVLVLLLPVLISVWIATAMLKIRIENQTATDLDLDTIRRLPSDAQKDAGPDSGRHG